VIDALASRPLLLAMLSGLVALLALAFCTWAVSFAKRDVSIVDSVWSVMILLAGGVYAVVQLEPAERVWWVVALVALWAVRLAGYITWRNWGEGEDHRYQAIRARNQPNFEWKSLYLVFVLQAVLAWIVSLSLLAAIASERPWGWLDTLGAVVVVYGIVFEAVGDAQLAAFKARPENRGKVMNRGLWRYTRHPNYFGEFCVWWGFYLMALSAGGWWALVSPLLMSVLLLKVSGVALLEKDIGERRPAYRDYIARTNAFFPGMPR
jgi:steroid 5-alpha reductase family enzyme